MIKIVLADWPDKFKVQQHDRRMQLRGRKLYTPLLVLGATT